MLKYILPIFLLAGLGMASALPAQETKASSPQVCQICTLVLTFAQHYVEQNQTESAVLGFIEQELCARLGSLSDTCKTYIETYGRTIIYELAQKVDPSIVCQHVGLCSAASARLSVDKCATCKLSVEELRTLLNNQDVENNALHYLENNVCTKLGGQLSTTCSSLLQGYGNQLFKTLVDYLKPDQVCQMANFCEAQRNFLEMIESSAECLKCTLAITAAKSELKNPAVQKTILTAAGQACNSLPSALHGACQTVVSAYGVQAINYVDDHVDPKKACQVLGKCQ